MEESECSGLQVKARNSDRIGLDAATVHELKTYLTAIIASAELLADEMQIDENEMLGRLINGIIRNGHNMNDKLTMLSEINKTQTDDLNSKLEAVEIKSVIKDVTARFYPITKSRQQHLDVELGADSIDFAG